MICIFYQNFTKKDCENEGILGVEFDLSKNWSKSSKIENQSASQRRCDYTYCE